MKKSFLIAVLSISSLLSSCQENKSIEDDVASIQKLQIADLKTLDRSATKANLTAILKTKNGGLISSESLKPGIEYIISLENKQGSELFVRNQEGFEITSVNKVGSQVEYSIKTNNVIPEKLYISIVPVVKEGGKFKKQNVSNFLLPQN